MSSITNPLPPALAEKFPVLVIAGGETESSIERSVVAITDSAGNLVQRIFHKFFFSSGASWPA